MATIIERDNDSPASIVFMFILFAIIIFGGIWFAYTHGMVANPTVIEHKTDVVIPRPPTPSHTP